MAEHNDSSGACLRSRSGLRAEFNANGSLRRFDCEAISLLLFVGNEIEGGPANLYLRSRGGSLEWTPLLGPRSPTRFQLDAEGARLLGEGVWHDVRYSLALVLAQASPVWFWHLRLENTAAVPQQLDLTYAQDLALAPYGAVRLNEFYVSQYLDHTPLMHAQRGVMIASRQNQAADGRYPWSLIGSLRQGLSFATDSLQLHGLGSRAGGAPSGLLTDLADRRLQHEHSMAVIRDAPVMLAAKQSLVAGFFGCYLQDHPEATSAADLERVAAVLALEESTANEAPPVSAGGAAMRVATHAATLFSAAPLLESLELDVGGLQSLFAPPWRHEEFDADSARLSFSYGAEQHVALRAKELRVLRPHGHILRTGRGATPDESGLTSTAWMGGVFHSMLTQGHVSINRLLSTVHSYLGLFRSHGQRVFAQIGDRWQLLDMPSAFEMSPDACRWIYRHADGLIEVRAQAHNEPQQFTLSMTASAGPATRFLISHHVALNDDDGSTPGPVRWRREGDDIVLAPASGSDLANRFPQGSFRISPLPGTGFEQVGGDELLFLDGGTHQQPFLCIVTAPATAVGVCIRGQLVPERARAARAPAASRPRLHAPPGPLAERVAQLADIVPWFTHDAMVHYLSPRGLEQYSGGGWGTRDVCQGPVEMLLALGDVASIRDLLLRVMSAQNPDGDWPQWFMFFDRERGIRAGDSHGDIVFWPLLVLAQYLLASGDSGLLEQRVRFFDARGVDAGESASVWQHAQRALALVAQRVIPGTALAAYGHGDWNDALQPADPKMRDHMCSAWTVTLHFQMLTQLARALRSVGRAAEAPQLESAAAAVQRDFARLLLIDGILAGYASFEEPQRIRYLLHPRDVTTGVQYSALAMIHAILEDLLTPAQAREHLRLIETHLHGPDGLRLFDRPMAYHGGPQRLFQRAESASFFGREIGLMYMHAHLRYAQALAHMGEAERFFRALCQANPIGIRAIVPAASLRQANCYYSSSDAAFEDRYQASAQYERVASGRIALDGGWRVYSSGAGIALGLIVRRFLGLCCEADALRLDPVIPPSLDGLRAETQLRGRALEVLYRIGNAGCGVQEIRLNRAPLPFTSEHNPHRRGAARLNMSLLLERLDREHNLLELRLG